MVKPQDKEMKMQWMTVDGRRTTIILPQIWDHEKEDWVVTSTENPLPTQLTGSYVEDVVDLTIPANSYVYTLLGSGEGYKYYAFFVVNPNKNNVRVFEHYNLPKLAHRTNVLEGEEPAMVSDVMTVKYSELRLMVLNRDDKEEVDLTIVMRRWN